MYNVLNYIAVIINNIGDVIFIFIQWCDFYSDLIFYSDFLYNKERVYA